MTITPPTLIFVGKTHSGKSTVASLLSKKLKYTQIDTDTFSAFTKENYPELIEYETKSNIYYDRESFKPFLKLLLQTTVFEYSLKNGFGVILCNGHLTKKVRKYNRKIAAKLGSKTCIVYFDLDDKIIRDRVSKSNRGTEMLIVSKSFEEVVEKQIKLFETPIESEADYFLKIDATKSPEEICNIIAEFVRSTLH